MPTRSEPPFTTAQGKGNVCTVSTSCDDCAMWQMELDRVNPSGHARKYLVDIAFAADEETGRTWRVWFDVATLGGTRCCNGLCALCLETSIRAIQAYT